MQQPSNSESNSSARFKVRVERQAVAVVLVDFPVAEAVRRVVAEVAPVADVAGVELINPDDAESVTNCNLRRGERFHHATCRLQ